MELTLAWAIVAIVAIITLLVFCYVVWQQTRLPASSRRSRKRRLVNEPIQNQRSQKVSSADRETASNAFPRTPPAAEQPQTHPSFKVNSGDERTEAKSSQEVDSGDERTHIGRRPQKNSLAGERTHIGHSQQDDAADDRTEIGRKRSKKVKPDDDRTVF
jgi:hypothetical protein